MARESKAVFMLLSPLDTKWRTRQRTNSLCPLRLISWSWVFKGNFCIYLETGNNGKLSDFLGNSENLDILVGQSYAVASFKTTLHSAFVALYLDFGSHYVNAAYFLTSLPCQRFFPWSWFHYNFKNTICLSKSFSSLFHTNLYPISFMWFHWTSPGAK